MKPFDLEAAKRGEPIQTRDGRPAKFVAHVPEANLCSQIVVLVCDEIYTYRDDGYARVSGESQFDLFMASRKRTVWVNLYESGGCYYYDTQKSADGHADMQRIGNRAWPLEIEE